MIVYADFNSVSCYLASQRADRLVRAGRAQVDWRAIEHSPRLPVTGVTPGPHGTDRTAEGVDDIAAAARLALPGERLPTTLPAVISNTRAAVSAYAEAVTDGIEDRLRFRLFELIWARGRNLSGPEEVRQVVTDLLWPADPIYPHLVSPDLPSTLLHEPDPMRIVRREGGTVAPDGGPLTTTANNRARQWRQEWLALLPEPVIPTVIGPDGAVHGGPDGLCAAWPGSPSRTYSAGEPGRAWRRPR